MNEDINSKTLQNDEIDLRELWVTLVKRKLTILAVTVIATISAAFYAYTATPIYSGKVLIEIGDVVINSKTDNNKPTIIQLLDSPADVQGIIEQTFNSYIVNEDKKIKIEFPKGSGRLILLSYESSDKNLISKKLQEGVNLVMARHKEKEEFFKHVNGQVHPTVVVDKISISDEPIKPKKQLIIAVAFISGLMLGIFLAFFREFISNGRKIDETPEMNKE